MAARTALDEAAAWWAEAEYITELNSPSCLWECVYIAPEVRLPVDVFKHICSFSADLRRYTFLDAESLRGLTTNRLRPESPMSLGEFAARARHLARRF